MLAGSEGDVDAVRMLLRMGAKTEQRCMGFTALVLSVREGHHDVVDVLLNEVLVYL